MTASHADACFHCGEALAGSALTVRIGELTHPVCCHGCQAVAELIASTGSADYYRYRDTPALRPAPPSTTDAWHAYAQPQVAAQFVQRRGELNRVDLAIEGLRCSACSWLLTRVLRQVPGVTTANINAAVGRGHIEWRAESPTTLADVMRTIAGLGYVPHVLENTSRLQQDERGDALKRLAVGAFGMMQVMMFAVSIYAADIQGDFMDPEMRQYFRVVSLLVSVPVLFYAGAPFLKNGLRALLNRSLGMDVPVSVALLLAFVASVWNTFQAQGEVYFDSITMFIFFLTLGRFVEMTVRHRATGIADALARHVPALAHRMRGNDIEDVPTASLAPGDRVLVRGGEIIPADGVIHAGRTHVSEALLTGESVPLLRNVGDPVVAGSVNTQDVIEVTVAATGTQTLLSGIVSLLRSAQAQKPALARAADRAAARFVRYLLICAGIVCAGWLVFDPSRAFEATLAVLVVACPCAFAIAMPAALAAASGDLARRGILVAKLDSLEALAHIDHVVFDKTGTLTQGEIRIAECVASGAASADRCLTIAAALERSSAHPIARAFREYDNTALSADDVTASQGFGIEGYVDGVRYRLGVPSFVAALRGATLDDSDDDTLALGDEYAEIARFKLEDSLRAEAPAAIQTLRQLGIDSEIVSGDQHEAVAQIARTCGIERFLSRQTPTRKLARAVALRDEGRRIAMLGDGINDAPILAAADVSIAMGRGAALAMASADLTLLNERLTALPESVLIARRTLRIARQNLFWSAAYNFSALPLAAFGLIPPWLAALGMSLSSIGVVLNAMRLLPKRTRPTTKPIISTQQAATVHAAIA